MLLMAVVTVKANMFIEGGIRYNDLAVGGDPQVGVAMFENATQGVYSGTVIIPETVKHNDTTYRVVKIENNAFHACMLDSVSIPNTVTVLDGAAFFEVQLNSITLPNRLDTIGQHAFMGTTLQKVTSLNPIPPAIDTETFSGFPSIIEDLYVPTGSAPMYREKWGNYFQRINGVFLGNTNVDTVTSNTVIIRWVNAPEAVNYVVTIYTADTVYRKDSIDSEGKVHRLKMPAIPHARMDTATSSTDFCVLTIDNMTSGTDYMYIVEGNDANNAPVYNETGVFRTEEEEEGVEDIPVNGERTNGRKVIRDGQVLILRDDRWITIQGQTIQP